MGQCLLSTEFDWFLLKPLRDTLNFSREKIKAWKRGPGMQLEEPLTLLVLKMHILGQVDANSQNSVWETLTSGLLAIGSVHTMVAFWHPATLASSFPCWTPWLLQLRVVNEIAHDTTLLSTLTYITFSCEWVKWIKIWFAWASTCNCWGLALLFLCLQRHHRH